MNKQQSSNKGLKKSNKGFDSGALPGTDSPLGRVIRRKENHRVTGLSDTTIWRLEKAGKFPARIQLSENTVGWLEQDVREWLESRKPAMPRNGESE